MASARRAAIVVAGVLVIGIGAGFGLQARACPKRNPAPAEAQTTQTTKPTPETQASQQPCQVNVRVGRPSLDPSLDKPTGPSCQGDEQGQSSRSKPAPQSARNSHHRRCGTHGVWVGMIIAWFSAGVPLLLLLIARDRRKRRAAKRAAQQDPNGQPPFQM